MSGYCPIQKSNFCIDAFMSSLFFNKTAKECNKFYLLRNRNRGNTDAMVCDVGLLSGCS